jgi:hypothetical protein
MRASVHLALLKNRSRKTYCLALCLGVLALAVPAASSAGTWGWTGFVPGGENGACYFYSNEGVCSPLENFSYMDFSFEPYNENDVVLAGYETSSAVRGKYEVNGSGSDVLYQSDYFASGPTKAGVTFCAGYPSCPFGSSDIWFNAHY